MNNDNKYINDECISFAYALLSFCHYKQDILPYTVFLHKEG